MARLPALRRRGGGALAKSQANPQVPEQVSASMDRQGLSWGSAFSPGAPIRPYSGYGGLPRAWNMPTGYNIVSRPQRDSRVSFDVLKSLTDSYDIARMCIGHRIDDVRSLGYAITAKRGYTGDPDAVTAEAERIIEYPEGPGGTLPFHAWIAKYLEDVLRYDAGALYRRRDKAGRVIGLKVVSGVTIAPVLDYWGDTPAPDAPAYVQFANGVPWKWMTTDDLIYVPFRPQPDSPYGFAPLEAVLLNANTDLRFQMHFLNWFTQGTVPEGFATAPEDISTPEQLEEYQQYWDSLLYGDDAAKHQLKFMPFGTKFEWPKDKPFDDKFPLYLMRKTAAAYHITPNDLGWTETVNRATADTQVDVQFRIGTMPLVEHLECIVNRYLQVDRGLPAEFHFDTGQEKEDRLAEAQTWQIYVDTGAASPDEMRRELTGLPVDPQRPTPRFYSTQRVGPIPLLAIQGAAGRVNPETYGPAKDQPALDQPFVPPVGVIAHAGTTDDQASLMALDQAQLATRSQLDREQGGTPLRESHAQHDQRGAALGLPQQPAAPAAPAPEAPPQVAKALSGAEASELAAFRRFVKQRAAWGRWTHDFEFQHVDPATAALLNEGGRAEVVGVAKSEADPQDADPVARAVYEQLLRDFPPQKVAWVLALHWTGPQTLPLDQVDFTNEDSWAASHQPQRVAKFADRIRTGKRVRPAILIDRPGHPQALVADGHHRAKAYKQQDRGVLAYVAHPRSDLGPWDELHASQIHGHGEAAEDLYRRQVAKAGDTEPDPPRARAAGVAVRAADTGRVLMLQRGLDESDPAAGAWEFPGGRLEDGESSAQAAVREWTEETGCALPEGTLQGAWSTPDGVYQGFVWQVPHETDVPIGDGRDEALNPDDPDGDQFEALAWWEPAQMHGNPALRPELLATLPQVHAALGAGQPVAKADADPKGQAPAQGPEQAQQWPGWQYDLAATAFWAPAVAAAFGGVLNARALAEGFLRDHPPTAAPIGEDPQDRLARLRAEAEAWLARDLGPVRDALHDAMVGILTDGYLIGAAAARASVDALEAGAEAARVLDELRDWRVGDTEAANLLLGRSGDGAGLRALLADAGVTIKSVAQTRLNELGRALAEGAARGDSAETIAASIRDLLTDKGNAHLVAGTELARAVSAAAVDTYQQRGYRQIEWLTAEDERVCPICDANEAEGPVRIGTPFPSGALQPPGHPRCRCAPQVVISSRSEGEGGA